MHASCDASTSASSRRRTRASPSACSIPIRSRASTPAERPRGEDGEREDNEEERARLDAVSIIGKTYTPSGVGGTPTISTFTRPILDAAGNPVLGPDGKPTFTTTVDPDFQGGYGTSLKNLFTNKYSSLQFGLTIQIPWKNRIAEANLGRALEQTKQIDLQVRKQTQDIETQIRNDVQAIEFAKMRIEAARAQQQYAQQQLEGEEKRFAAGLTTTFFVLQRQNELSVAKGQYIRALTDYNKLVATLQRDIGTTLTNNNIEVNSDANPNGDKK